MAENKKSFIAYSDWKGTFDALSNDKAGELIKHIFSYVNDENPKTDDMLINAVFSNIKNALKRDLKRWEGQHQQRVNAGKKSAEIRKRNATVVNGRSFSSTVSDSVSVSVNGSVKKKDDDEISNLFKNFLKEVSNGEHSASIEQMYMTLKIKKGSLTPLVKEFNGSLIITNKLHKNTLEFRKHFFNWLNTQEKVGKLDEHKRRR